MDKARSWFHAFSGLDSDDEPVLTPDHVIQHEVLFESDFTTIHHQPLFLGSAFSLRRYIWAGVFCVCLCTGLLLRAGWMQILQAKNFQALSDANRLRTVPIWPQRGVIQDRQGRILAENISRFQITMTPRDLPALAEERVQALGEAARVLGVPLQELLSISSVTGSARDETFFVADHVPYDLAMAFAVAQPQLPGFRLEVRPMRRYPFSHETESISHVLGYVGKISSEEYQELRNKGYRHADEIGKAGIEKSYETLLRGQVGEIRQEVDARGRIKGAVSTVDARDGIDVKLTLDLSLQNATERVLKRVMRERNIKRAAVVVMDPRDGSILTLVSLPSFDNNIFSGIVSSTVYDALTTNPDQPLLARAWMGSYPSGSTIKLIGAVAALAEKVITPQTTIVSTGGIRIGSWFFPDWKAGGHGTVNVRSALAWSVNTFFYMVAGGYDQFRGMGVDTLLDWYHRFGLGQKTGIDLPGEAAGFLPSRAWKEREKKEPWYIGDTYHVAIGQGDVTVTPVQVAVYTSIIANGGHKIVPRLFPLSGSTTSKELIVDSNIIRTVQLGMRDTILYGSGRALNFTALSVAGKTGTAQWRTDRQNHAWFTGYAPFEAPEIVVTVLCEEGIEGSSVSVPIAGEVFREWDRLRALRGGSF